MYYTILYCAILYYLDPATPTLPISATLRLQDTQALCTLYCSILRFTDPLLNLLKRKNLIGRDDRFP